MRLQLTIAASVIATAAVATSRPAAAQPADAPEATATLRFYADDDHVTVTSPAASATTAVGAHTTIDVDAAVDIVSAASIDVLTAASASPVHEVRVEGGARATRRLPWGAASTVALAGHGSHEHDYDALDGSVAGHVEVAERNTTLELRYALERDRATSVVDASFERTRTAHRLTATVSQVLDEVTLVDVIGDGMVARGYQANPYRRVAIELPAWPTARYLDEVTPSDQASLALAARVRRAVAATWFATTTYRFYFDDWDLTSHTVTLDLRHPLGDHVLVGAGVRGYLQSGASFYRGHYQATTDGTAPALRTADRTLGPMRDLSCSVAVDVTLGTDDAWHLVLAAGAMRSWFLDFPAQAGRAAVTSTATLSRAL